MAHGTISFLQNVFVGMGIRELVGSPGYVSMELFADTELRGLSWVHGVNPILKHFITDIVDLCSSDL